MLNQAVDDLQKDLVTIRQSYAEVMATQKRMQRQKDQADQLGDEWCLPCVRFDVRAAGQVPRESRLDAPRGRAHSPHPCFLGVRRGEGHYAPSGGPH